MSEPTDPAGARPDRHRPGCGRRGTDRRRQRGVARPLSPVLAHRGGAIRSCDGRIWTGIHLGATVGRLQVCAEPIAYARALIEGDGTIATAVAVRHPKDEEDHRAIAVVSPCGACRELIADYAPDATIIVPTLTGLTKLPIRALLPLPYRR